MDDLLARGIIKYSTSPYYARVPEKKKRIVDLRAVLMQSINGVERPRQHNVPNGDIRRLKDIIQKTILRSDVLKMS